MTRFSYDTFVSLMKTKGPKVANNYRDSLKNPKTENEEKNDSIEGVIIDEKEEIGTNILQDTESSKNSNKVYSRDDLKKLLNDSNVAYFLGAKDEVLLKKCIENNLI